MPIVILPAERIVDRETFHAVCADVFGFPGFYGRNMNAWIDCLSYLDEEGSGMSRFTLKPDEYLTIEVGGTEALNKRVPDVLRDLIECAAFVNQRYLKRGRRAPIALVFC